MGVPIRLIILAAILLSVTGSAGAVATIDQEQANQAEVIAEFYYGDLAQSFQQAHDDIAGAGIFLSPGYGSGGTVTISLWDRLPNLGGVQLAVGSAAGTPGSWVDMYWAPVTVVPDTTLFLLFASTDENMGISGDTQDPYPRGQAYAVTGFEGFPAYDYAFRTYYDDSFAGVPVPGALLLGSIGAGIVGWTRRRSAF